MCGIELPINKTPPTLLINALPCYLAVSSEKVSEFIVADFNVPPAAVNHGPVITSGNSFIRLFNLQMADKNLGWSSTK